MKKVFILIVTTIILSCSNKIVIPTSNISTISTKIIIEEVAQNPISPDLFGYNIVYAETPDRVWGNGKIKDFTKETNTSFIRYPGGTVVTFWHWKNPTGNGWSDSWNPAYNEENKPDTEFMDIDEYLNLVQELQIKPMIGVNINSGYVYNRMEEGIKDAVDLMDYCANKGIKVEYWYLGNEPYMRDSNGGSLTIEEYAMLINVYADKMRQINSSIKLIVNWYANFFDRESEYDTLLKLAGHNIDVIDIHNYWDWNTASWERWLQKTPIGLWTGQSYIANINKFREITLKNGYPDIQLATLEWNAGPGHSNDIKLTKAQNAFVQSEMMIQFMLGGMDIATFWPLFWKSGQFNERGIYDFEEETLNPNTNLFKELSKLSGTNYFDTKVSEKGNNILHIFSEEKQSKTFRGCILNKNSNNLNLTVEKMMLSNYDNYSIMEYCLASNNEIIVEDITGNLKSEIENEINIQIKPYSLVFIEAKLQ